MLCFHGTSVDNLDSILKNGILATSKKIWNVSCEEVYFRTIEYSNLIGDTDNEDHDELLNNVLRQAFESATLSMIRSKDCRAAVLVFDIDESEMEQDNSCEGMYGCYCVARDIKPEEIKGYYISQDFSLLKGAFINWYRTNTFCNLQFTNIEKDIAKLYCNYCADVELEWEYVGEGAAELGRGE